MLYLLASRLAKKKMDCNILNRWLDMFDDCKNYVSIVLPQSVGQLGTHITGLKVTSGKGTLEGFFPGVRP